MSGIPPGLVRFCLEHTDSAELASHPPSLNPADLEFLQSAFSAIEDDPKRLKRHLQDAGAEDGTPEDVTLALEEVRELVEQIDNACDLAPLGGWPIIVSLLGGHPPPAGQPGGSNLALAATAPRNASPLAEVEDVKAAAIAVVKAAVANNPRGLVAAAHCGAVRPIVEILVNPSSTVRLRAQAASAAMAMCGVSSEVSDALAGSPYAIVPRLAVECASGTKASGRCARLLLQMMRSCVRDREEVRKRIVDTGACAAMLWLAGVIPTVGTSGNADANEIYPLLPAMNEPPSDDQVLLHDREGALRAVSLLITGDNPDDIAASEDLKHATAARPFAAEVLAIPGIRESLSQREEKLQADEDQEAVEDELELVRSIISALESLPEAMAR